MMKMIRIENEYPNLVNCLGRLDYYNPKCQEGCNYPYECLQIRRELKSIPEFMSVGEKQRMRNSDE